MRKIMSVLVVGCVAAALTACAAGSDRPAPDGSAAASSDMDQATATAPAGRARTGRHRGAAATPQRNGAPRAVTPGVPVRGTGADPGAAGAAGDPAGSDAQPADGEAGPGGASGIPEGSAAPGSASAPGASGDAASPTGSPAPSGSPSPGPSTPPGPSAPSPSSTATVAGQSLGYSATADAPAQADAALAAAKQDRKAVLLVFGANWCGNCAALERTMRLPAVRSASAAYHVVRVDVGDQVAANSSLLARYHSFATSQAYGMPVLVVLSPAGAVRVDTLKTGNPPFDEAHVAAFLKRWE